MQPAALTDPPPEPVERAPQWPAWFAGAGFLVGITGTLVLVSVFAVILGVDGDGESSGFIVLAVLVQGVVLVGTAVLFASFVSPPRAWHFGLRRTALGRAAGWAVLGLLGYYVVTAVYATLVPTDVDQGVTDDLGAGEGTLGLIVAGFMVVVVAPVAEEFFFRGFFYRALRSRFTVIAAAAIDGLLFGLIHFSFESAEALLLVPALGLLGFVFCLVYEKTGSLYPVIAMHAFNNTIAFAAQTEQDGGWRVSLVLGPLMLAACVLVPRLVDTSPARARAPTPG